MNTRCFVLNCPVDLVSCDKAIEIANNAIVESRNFHIVTINPEMIMNAQTNAEFLNLLNNSDLNIMDGVGVRLALKFRGINKAQIRGVDFSRELIKLASEKEYRIAFLGAKEEVIKKACENFKLEYPNLNIVYSRNGYFDNLEQICEEIKTANPQILLVGMGSPYQEEIIVKLKNILQGCTMIGVGGSFDVFSGIVKESPVIYRKLGLEWLYRTVCQPERFKRIFPVLPLFLIKCIIETIFKKG